MWPYRQSSPHVVQFSHGVSPLHFVFRSRQELHACKLQLIPAKNTIGCTYLESSPGPFTGRCLKEDKRLVLLKTMSCSRR